MTSREQFFTHKFGGGWATDFGPNAAAVPDQSGNVVIPFLVDAEDCLYELDGGPHKAPGASKLNSSVLESGAIIKGLVDYWSTGVTGISTQHRVCHVGSKIKKDDADGSFADLFTGLVTGAVPGYSIFDDFLIISSDASDVPKSWDGTTAQDLAGSPPNFAFSETHKNRTWAAGAIANPSRLYYCALLDPEDWVGAGSGSIDIDPDDGDRITAIASHKDELWVFKGPHKGSIHRITGSAPTGTDAFARKTFITGLGAVNQNTLFRFRDDLGFVWSDGSVRSLKATAAFGDFNQATLSLPININFLDKRLNFSRLKHAWSEVDDTAGLVLFTIPIDSSADNNSVLAMDIRFDPVRWSRLPSYKSACLASVIDPGSNDRRIIMTGGNDGFIRKLGQSTRSIDGTTALNYKVTSPFIDYNTPIMMKTFTGGAVGVAPKNNGDITVAWTRDNNSQQTTTVSQGATDVLGTASSSQFTLGTSALGGSVFVDRFFDAEEGGEFRAIQFQFTNSVNNEDVEIHSVAARIHGGGWSMEN